MAGRGAFLGARRVPAVQVGAQLYSKGAYKEASEAYGTACGAYTETSAAAGDEHSLLKAIYCNRAASHKKQGLFKEALEVCGGVDGRALLPPAGLARGMR